jgi:hypothetical protein
MLFFLNILFVGNIYYCQTILQFASFVLFGSLFSHGRYFFSFFNFCLNYFIHNNMFCFILLQAWAKQFIRCIVFNDKTLKIYSRISSACYMAKYFYSFHSLSFTSFFQIINFSCLHEESFLWLDIYPITWRENIWRFCLGCC